MAMQRFGQYFTSYAREGGEQILLKLDIEDDLLAKISIETQGQERGAIYFDADDVEALGKWLLHTADMMRANDEAWEEDEDTDDE